MCPSKAVYEKRFRKLKNKKTFPKISVVLKRDPGKSLRPNREVLAQIKSPIHSASVDTSDKFARLRIDEQERKHGTRI